MSDVKIVDHREEKCKPFAGVVTLNTGERIMYFGGWWYVDVGDGSVQKCYLMITDKEIDGKRYIFDDRGGEVLQSLGIRITKFPEVKPEPRWHPKYLQMYLDGREMNYAPEDVYDILVDKFNEYIDYGNEWGAPMLLALETIKTYLMPIFNTTGYIVFTGMRKTGKSKNLDVLEQVVFNPYRVTEPSASSIFRGVSDYQSTFLIDESDLDLPDRAPTIRTILLAGYRRGPMIPRVEKMKGEKLSPVLYDPFGPKIMVAPYGIATQGREAMVLDRSIIITMQKSSDPNKTRKIVKPSDPVWAEIRAHLYVFALKHWEEIEKIYLECGDELGFDSRNDEIWRPLYAVAKFFGVDQELKRYAIEKIEMSMVEESESPEIKLMRFLLGLVKGMIPGESISLMDEANGMSGAYVSPSELERMMTNYYGKEKWITSQNIGRLMTSVLGLSVRPWKVIKSGRPYYFLEEKKLSQIAKRYGIDPDDPLNLK